DLQAMTLEGALRLNEVRAEQMGRRIADYVMVLRSLFACGAVVVLPRALSDRASPARAQNRTPEAQQRTQRRLPLWRRASRPPQANIRPAPARMPPKRATPIHGGRTRSWRRAARCLRRRSSTPTRESGTP